MTAVVLRDEHTAGAPTLERPPVEKWFLHDAARRVWLRADVTALVDVGDAWSRLEAIGMLLRFRRSGVSPCPMETAIRSWLAEVGSGRLAEIEGYYLATAIRGLRDTRNSLDRYDRRDYEREAREDDLEVVVRDMIRDRDDLQSACAALLFCGGGSASVSALAAFDAEAQIDELIVSLVDTEGPAALEDRLGPLWRRKARGWWIPSPLQ